MTDDRKKPGAAFWTTVAIVGVLLYVASFGPACWMYSRTSSQYPNIGAVYCPLLLIAEIIPGSLRILVPYATFGMPENGWIRFRHRDSIIVDIRS